MAMAYYIKTLGIKNKPVSIFKDRYPRMLLSQMCFKTQEGKVSHIKKGDTLVVYCLRNAFKEFPHGGFIGIQDVLSPMYEDPTLSANRLNISSMYTRACSGFVPAYASKKSRSGSMYQQHCGML